MADTLKIIGRGGFNCVMDLNTVVQMDEAHDGIAFQNNTGFHISYTDTNMPQPTKQRIKATIQTIRKGDIVINLTNYTNPVVVTVS